MKLSELEKKVIILLGGYRKILKKKKKEMIFKYDEIIERNYYLNVYEKIKV